MGDFRNILLFAVGIGVLHVFLGVGLGIYTAIRRGRPGEVVSKAAGLAFLAAVAAAIAGGAGWAPRIALYIGLAGIPASLLLMVLGGGAGAAMEAHNLLNIFSYLRITGIGVASVSLAYTANRLVPLIGIPALGILAALTLHAINLAFCVLSPPSSPFVSTTWSSSRISSSAAVAPTNRFERSHEGRQAGKGGRVMEMGLIALGAGLAIGLAALATGLAQARIGAAVVALSSKNRNRSER